MNKSKFLKKSLAAVLALLMIVAMIPLSAAAEAGKITSFTVNGSVATISGTNITATVKDATDVDLGAVCDDGTTIKGVDKDGGDIVFTTTNGGWLKETLDLTTVADEKDDVYTLKIIASTDIPADDSTTDTEYTLTITVEPDADSGDNLVKTVQGITDMVDYTIDNAKGEITIVMGFGATAHGQLDADGSGSGVNFTYSDDATGSLTGGASGADAKLTVTAQNQNTRKYTVKTVWQSPFKSFSVEGQTADAEIKTDNTNMGKLIEVKMPYGTAKTGTDFIASFEKAEGVGTVKIKGGAEIVSGKTKLTSVAYDDPNTDGKITLTVQDANKSDVDVVVHLIIPQTNPEGLLKAVQVSAGTANSNQIDVDEDTRAITVEMPSNTKFSDVGTVKFIASTGATVRIVEQNLTFTATGNLDTLSSTVNLKGEQFTLRVKSQDGKTTNDYVVKLTKAAAAENKLNNFTLKGEIDGEKIERSAVWNGETGTVTMPYAFKDSNTWDDIKVYATSSVGSKIYLSDGATEVTNFGSDYETLWNSGTSNVVPAIDATAAFEYVVKNTENGKATYKIFIKTEAPRTQKSFISGTMVGTKDVKAITPDNTYSVTGPTKVKDQNGTEVNALKLTLPHGYTLVSGTNEPVFSALTLSPGAAAYIMQRDGKYKKIEALDPDKSGAQTVAVGNFEGCTIDNLIAAYNKDTGVLTTTTYIIRIDVVSEKYAVGAADEYANGSAWAASDAGKNAEHYYMYVEKAPAEKGNTMTSLASTLDTNVTASVNNSTQTINITVPNSYNNSASETFSLNFALSKMAKAYHGTAKTAANVLTSDLGSKDTSGKTEFKIVGGKLQTGSSGDIAVISVFAEDGTKREYKVNVKVNDPEKGYALTGVEATCGTNKGTGRISGTTVNLTMPFGTKLFPAKLKLTASKMAEILVDGAAYDENKSYDLTNDIKVTVTAEDEEHSQIYTIKTTLGERFTDVPANAWFAPYVDEAYDREIIEGQGNGIFNPNGNITRQDFALMTVRMLGKEDEAKAMENDPIAFSDADRIADYAKGAVAYCATNKILNGYDTGKFEPTLTITREEAAKILAVAKGLEVTGTPDFADNSRISGWAQPYVAAVQAAGIFKGDEANRFNPQQKITRAETAKVMVESLKK